MAVIAGCIALVLAGAAMIVRWGGAPPRPATDGLLRYAGVAVAAGVVAGLLAAGAGGRLVMRLLAITSPAAEGSFTEAGEVIGEITFAGTVGFILFTGLAAGLLSAVLYALVRPVLPPGRAGGLALGLLLLVVAGTRVEPLVADNIDFVVLGPAWLAVLAFSALALFHGMLVAAVAARLSGQPPPALRAGPRAATAGRIATGAVLLVALPGFVTAVADIL